MGNDMMKLGKTWHGKPKRGTRQVMRLRPAEPPADEVASAARAAVRKALGSANRKNRTQ